MGFTIHYHANKDLPKLAWLAKVDPHTGRISIIHGSSVECRDDWMVEGVWDADFEQGKFHQSENFFGSGIRVDEDRIYCVPSSATTDGLMYCEDEGNILVSNSLIMLLAATGAALDENHDYRKESLSILEGIDKYGKEFTIRHPQIKCFYQVFYENIVIYPTGIRFEKRSKPHTLTSFDQYYRLIKEVLVQIKDNYESPKRKIPISAFTTLSTGYDSTAVSCLVRDIGVKKCFTGNRLELPIHMRVYTRLQDDGTLIARCLGLEVLHLDSKRSSISEDELYFLAANYPKFTTKACSEIPFHSMASYIEKNCSAAVVFTGNVGDLVWDVNLEEEYRSAQIKRSGLSGNGLTEIRLKSGFISVGVPYILARNQEDIIAIARSPELDPWRLNTSYDRPIPRRIAETSGVDRRLFGMQKKFIGDAYLWPVNAHLRREFFKYLKAHHGINPVQVYTYFNIEQLAKLLQVLLKKDKAFKLKKFQYLVFSQEIDLYFLMNLWARKVLSDKMAAPLAQQGFKIFSADSGN